MARSKTIDERITALEQELEQIKAQLKPPAKKHWLENFIGAFADEPAFDDVIRYGREFRYADRPADLDKEAS